MKIKLLPIFSAVECSFLKFYLRIQLRDNLFYFLANMVNIFPRLWLPTNYQPKKLHSTLIIYGANYDTKQDSRMVSSNENKIIIFQFLLNSVTVYLTAPQNPLILAKNNIFLLNSQAVPIHWYGIAEALTKWNGIIQSWTQTNESFFNAL